MLRDRAKRWAIWIAAGLAGLWIGYALLANALLVSGALEHLLSPRPERTRLAWDSAWSFVPGRVHVRGFALAGQTQRVQYRLEIDRALVRVRLSDLLARRFHAESVDAEGLVYHQRPQRSPTGPLAANRTLEPPLDGLPERSPGREVLARRAPREHPWRIQLDRVQARDVREIWIGPYRGCANGSLVGALDLRLPATLSIEGAMLELPGLVARVGDRVVGQATSLAVGAACRGVDTRRHRGRRILSVLDGQVGLEGRFADFGFLNAFFGELPGLGFAGEGELSVDLALRGGALEPGGRLRFDSDELVYRFNEASASGHGVVELAIDGPPASPRAALKALLEGIQLDFPGSRSTLDGPGLTVLGSADVSDLGAGLRGLEVTIDLPRSRAGSLADLGRILPESVPLRTGADSEAHLRFRAELTRESVSGELEASSTGVEAFLGEALVRADVVLRGELATTSEPSRVLHLPRVSLDVTDIAPKVGGEPAAKRGRVRAELEDVRVHMTAPVSVEARAEASLADLDALVTQLVASPAGERFANLCTGDRLLARARLKAAQDDARLTDIELAGSGLAQSVFGPPGFSLEATASRLDLTSGLHDLRGDLALEGGRLEDLSRLNAFLPADGPLRILPGSGASLDATLRLRDLTASGDARLVADDTRLRLGGRPLGADLDLGISLGLADLETGRLELGGSRLSVSDLQLLQGQPLAPGWWAELEFSRLGATLGDVPQLSGEMTLKLRDTEPLLAALSPEGRHGLRAEDLFDLREVWGHSRLELDAGTLALVDLEIQGHSDAGGLLAGRGVDVRAQAKRATAERGFENLRLHLDLPRSELKDLAAVTGRLPPEARVRVAEGTPAQVEAELDVVDGRIRGAARLHAESARIEIAGQEGVGDIDLEAHIADGDLASQTLEVVDSALSIADVVFPDDEGQGEMPWSAVLRVPRATLGLDEPLSIHSELGVVMSDTRPILGAVLRTGTSPWVAGLLDFRDLEARLRLELVGSRVVLSDLRLEGASDPGGNPFGASLRVTARGDEIVPREGLAGLDLSVTMPTTALGDLSVLNAYLPEQGGARLLPGGQGFAEGSFELSDGAATGRLRVFGNAVPAALAGVELTTDLSLRARVGTDDLTHSAFELEEFDLHLDGLTIAGGRLEDADWWARLRLEEGAVVLGRPLTGRVRLELRSRDTGPAVEILRRRGWVERRIAPWLWVEDVAGSLVLGIGPDRLVLDDVLVVGDRLNLASRLEFSEAGRSARAYLKLGWLALGLSLDGEETGVHIFGPRSWYQRHLDEIEPAKPALGCVGEGCVESSDAAPGTPDGAGTAKR